MWHQDDQFPGNHYNTLSARPAGAGLTALDLKPLRWVIFWLSFGFSFLQNGFSVFDRSTLGSIKSPTPRGQDRFRINKTRLLMRCVQRTQQLRLRSCWLAFDIIPRLKTQITYLMCDRASITPLLRFLFMPSDRDLGHQRHIHSFFRIVEVNIRAMGSLNATYCWVICTHSPVK